MKKRTKELKQMTGAELKDKIITLRKEQFSLRMRKSAGVLDKTHVVKILRREIARIKTIMTEKVGSSDVNS